MRIRQSTIRACVPIALLWQLQNLGSVSTAPDWNHQAVFQARGTMQETVGFVHLKVVLPVQQIHSLCHQLTQWHLDLQGKVNQTFLMDTPKLQLQTSQNSLDTACQKMSPKFSPRPKRSVWTTVLGTIFGLFGLDKILGLADNQQTRELQQQQHHLLHEVQQLQSEVNLDRINQDILDKRTQNNHQRINFVEKELQIQQEVDYFSQTVQQFVKEVEMLVEGLNELEQGRVTQHLLPSGSFSPMFPTLLSSAKTLGGVPALDIPEQVYQLPISALMQEQDLVLLIHIPVVTTSQPWILYRLHHRPLLLPGGSNESAAVLAHLQPEDRLLAVHSEPEEFVTFSEERLSGCLHLGQHHFCEALMIFTNSSSTCLSRLFVNNLKDLPLFCPIHLTTKNYVMVPSEDSWIGFHQNHQPVILNCLNGTHRVQLYQGYFQLPWAAGCSYTTPQVRLTGAPTPPSETLGTVINLTPTLKELIGFQVHARELEELSRHQGYSSPAKKSTPFSELLRHRHHLEEVQDQKSQSHLFLGLHGILAILLGSVIGFLGICTWKNFQASRPEK